MGRVIELEAEIPRSGQAYRTARDGILSDFAELLVQAGIVQETFEDGKLRLSAIAPLPPH